MSEWHRDNPEMVGTDADPHMAQSTYRTALEELRAADLVYVEDEDEAMFEGEDQ